MPNKILILASSSPRRIEILKKNKIKFKTEFPNIKEESSFKKPDLIVKELALKKALYIANKYKDNPVLAADTIVYCNRKIIGKPKDERDAFKILKILNGRWQKVYTGISLIWIKKNIFLCDFEKSSCLAKKLSNSELKNIASKHLDKAGAYAVQDKDDYFIKKILGRYDNVVGLPMNIVRKFLKKIKYLS